MTLIRRLALIAPALILATGCGGGGTEPEAADAQTRLEETYAACRGEIEDSGDSADGEDSAIDSERALTQLELGDEGRSLSVSKGDYYAEMTIFPSACVLGRLKAPDSTLDLMDSTTALMGRQSDSWDGLEAEWSYHPDAGLNLVITDQRS